MNKARTPFAVGTLLLSLLGLLCFTHLKISNAQSSFSISFNHVIIDSNGPSRMWAKTVGDFNGDGLDDLMVAGEQGAFWYENPTWTKHAVLPGDYSLNGAATGDIDNDGDNDIITGSWYGREVYWLENPGSGLGTWNIHAVFQDLASDAIYVNDLDGDGDLDIIGRSSQTWGGDQGKSVYIWRQDSPTSWTDFTTYVGGGEHFNIGDVDRDGDMDFIVANRWYENPGHISSDWTEHVFTDSWTHLSAFPFVADINGDGRPDIVLTPTEQAGEYYRTSWFEAPADPKSNGWIEHVIENNVECVTHSLEVADMDNDGDLDVVTAEMHQSADPDEVRVYLNEDGDGVTWTKEVVATKGSHYAHLVDVEPDGDYDIFGSNHSDTTVIDLWVNQACSLTLDDWERHIVDPEKPWQTIFITSADVDGDGQQDIITGGWWYQNPGSPGGTWTRNTIGSPLNNMAAVYDFDGDGDIDVLGTPWQGSGADPNFVWARNNGSGTFTILADTVSSGVGDFLQGVAVARFQPGGSLEVALSWHNGTGQGVQMLTVPSNLSSNTWPWRRISTEDQEEELSADDIDHDGDVDLLLGTKWLRNDGSSWSMQTLSNTGEQPDRNRLADMNGDGRLDAVVGFLGISQPAKLAWYEQGADATTVWTEHVIATDVVGPMSLDVADMDKDGDFDVIVGEHNMADPSSAKLYVFENTDGQGHSWAEHVVYTGDEHHDGAQVVDIDGDGDLDIISIGWGHNRVLLYENKAAHCGGGTPMVETPAINSKGGTFSGPVSVTLSTTTPGASIYYTLDGSEPTMASTLYTEPFTLTGSATVKARGFRSGYNPSNVASASFTSGRVPRVTDGQQVLYTFKEGSGTTVYDVSGTGTPLNLSVENGNAVSWLPGHGLAINSATLVASAGAATKIIDAKDTGEITIEAWVKPANTTQDGPARIVTLSEDPYKRNFSLEQGLWGSQPSDVYDVRLRATSTGDDGTMLATPASSASTQLSHVVYTRDASGVARIYVNNVEWASGTVGGDFSNWDESFRLALANELTEDRPWLGEFHLVAIYNRALSQAQVSQNFNAGLTTTITPVLWLHLIPQKWQ